MSIQQKYISSTSDLLSSFKSQLLHERIKSLLTMIRFSIDDKFIYHESYTIQYNTLSVIKNDDDLCSSKNRNILLTLYSFLKSVPKDMIEYEEYYEDKYLEIVDPYRFSYDVLDEFMLLDSFLEEFDKIIQQIEYIISSFDYNYQEMREKKKDFYLELAKYVFNPSRIEKISNDYNMEWDEYLDTIDL